MDTALPPPDVLHGSGPVTAWEDGTLRIAGTRVHLGHVVDAYNSGETPEQMVEQAPALPLYAVYGAIGVYLSHKSELDQWLAAKLEAGWAALRELDADPKVQALKARAREIIAQRHAATHG